MSEKLTAQQRANLFNMSTRENKQMIAKQTVTTGGTSIQFTLPKARLLSNIYLKVKATIKATHASATELAVDALAPFRVLRRLTLDLNNGFSPYSVSGEGLAIMNMIQLNGRTVTANTAYHKAVDKFVCSANGTDNEIEFVVQLPVTLNNRDVVGMILLQSEQTTVDLRLDIANAIEMFPNIGAGYTVDIVRLEAMPMLQTFSVPANGQAFPDLSVLKLVQDRTDTITSAGQHLVKLSTGTIYRKLVLFITDENGNPVDNEWIASNIDLVFNTADCNYSIEPSMLRAVNAFELGFDVPKGVYMFDFSTQGIPNMGGVRDYIDTEKLTEFVVRFNSTAKGSVKIITECLARLV